MAVPCSYSKHPVSHLNFQTIKMSQPGDVATSELYQKHKELEMQTQTNMTMS
jgi:hypothetical protein